MKRRTVLAAAATATGIAGCLASSDDTGSGGGDDGGGNSTGEDGGGDPNGTDDGSGGGDGSGADDGSNVGGGDDGSSGNDGGDDGNDGSDDGSDGSDQGNEGREGDGSEITGRSIETTEQTCGNQDVSEASITVEDGAIVVVGTVSASTPCHDAVLSSAAVGDRALRMGVELSQQDGYCQDCLGEISYEATIELGDPNALDSVQVSHEGGGMHRFDVE